MSGEGRLRLSVADVRRLGQQHAHLDADPTYARLVLRRVSYLLTSLVVRFTPLSADGVTVLWVLVGCAGGVAVLGQGAVTNVIAAALLQASFLLDLVDGEVARVRGTASKRGTYLDLVGHFLVNRTMLAASAFSLVVVTGAATWAIVIALIGVGYTVPFGLFARSIALGRGGENQDHARIRERRPRDAGVVATAYWLYRRVAFVWNFPASMNLFSLALIVDAVRFLVDPGAGALAVPGLFVVFSLSLALKQLLNAVRLLSVTDWSLRT